ncbi:unnamed protein product [Cuscuta epithymum]|uniref:Putative plant transposon protein domain-containing protein n=1 Tax=Cuscuta epithymum TaxID=186058 RepID=A0AAV0CNE3_9ASTE|nr:unnamed protein product [Cuscuta epithymum]CAH9121846.1 unnamed protein product [Cuscuta epithymum]
MSSSSSSGILEGKAINPKHFSADFLQLLSIQHLLKQFLVLKNPTYPNLVREFYENLKKHPTSADTITTHVQGKEILLSAQNLEEWLSLPLRGISAYSRDHWAKDLPTPPSTIMDDLSGKPVDGSSERVIKQSLPGEVRLISLLITKCILPVRNNSDCLGKLESSFTYFIKNRILVNWPSVMIQHMISSVKKSNLPYGMLISWILETRYGVGVNRDFQSEYSETTIDEVYLRSVRLYRVDGNAYLTENEILALPEAQRPMWFPKPKKRARRARTKRRARSPESGRPSSSEPRQSVEQRPLFDFSTEDSALASLERCEDTNSMKEYLRELTKKMFAGFESLKKSSGCDLCGVHGNAVEVIRYIQHCGGDTHQWQRPSQRTVHHHSSCLNLNAVPSESEQ